jgi:hypothetical protein
VNLIVVKSSRCNSCFSLQDNAEDGSVENLRSDTSSPLVEDGSSGAEYIPIPPGWRETCDEDSGQPCYVYNATGAKVSCKPLQVAGSWK